MTTEPRTPTPSEATTLLSCPFCDGACAVTKGYSRSELPWGDDGGDFYRVFCAKCQSRQLFHRTEADAIEAWNRRALAVPTAVQAAGEAVGVAVGVVMTRFNATKGGRTTKGPELYERFRNLPNGTLLYLAAPTLADRVPQWISVDDRLPEEGVPVVVTKDGGVEYLEIDIMEEGSWRNWLEYVEHVEIIGGRTSDVKLYTHWAPLPKPAGIGAETLQEKKGAGR